MAVLLLSPSLQAQAAPATATPAPAAAVSKATMTAFAIVTAVTDPQTIVVDRGTNHELNPGASDLVVRPVLKSKQHGRMTAHFDLRSARATVASATASTATLKLRVIASPVKVGDLVAYSVTGPQVRQLNPLFVMAIKRVRATFAADGKEVFDFKETDKLGAPAAQAAFLERVAKDLRDHSVTSQGVFNGKQPSSGKYKGLTMAAALAQTTGKDVQSYLHWITSAPNSLVGQTHPIANIYGMWVLHGTPDDNGARGRLEVAPLKDKGDRLVTGGQFAAAETVFRKILGHVPNHPHATRRLDALKQISTWTRELDRKPDANKVRLKLAQTLLEVGAFKAGLKQCETLVRHKYRPSRINLLRARFHSKTGRFDEALPVLEAALKKSPKNKSLQDLVVATKAEKVLATAADAYQAYMSLAAVALRENAFAEARRRFHQAMDAAQTKEALEAADLGARRVSLLADIDRQKSWVLDDIGTHHLARANKRIGRVLHMATKAGRPAARNQLLQAFADKARSVWERELAIKLHKQRAREFPSDKSVWFEMGWTAFQFGDVETAEWAAGRCLALAPDSAEGNHLKSLVYARLGDYERALKFSSKADRPGYAYPLTVQARIAAARGATTKALKLIKRAHDMLPKGRSIRQFMKATIRLHKARRTLASKGLSASKRAREHLRVVRSLSQLQLPRLALRELEHLKRHKALYTDAAWDIVKHDNLPMRQRMEAATLGKFNKPYRKLVVRELTAASIVALNAEVANRRELAEALIATGRFHRAIAALGRHKLVSKDRATQLLVGRAQTGLKANKLVRYGNYAKNNIAAFPAAVKAFKKARAMYREVGYIGGYLDSAFGETSSLTMVPKHAEALALGRSALAEARSYESPNRIYDMERAIAFLEATTGSLNAVSAALKRAHAGCLAADKEYCLALISRELANLRSNEGRLTDAEAYARESLRWSHQIGNPSLQREALASLAEIYLHAGRLKDAERRANKLLKVARETLGYRHQRVALLVLGAVAMKRGKSKEALGYFDEAYRIGSAIGRQPERAQAQLMMGRVYMSVDKDYKKAAKHFTAAGRMFHGAVLPVAAASANLAAAEAKARLGQTDQARTTYNSVLKVARKLERRPLQASVLTAQALLEAADGKPKAAMAAANGAVKLAETLQTTESLWLAYYAKGRALEAASKPAKALALYRKAITLSSKNALLAGDDAAQAGVLSYGFTGELFERTISLLLEMRQVNAAMLVLETSRNQKLRRIFAPGKLKSNKKEVQASLVKMRNVNARLSAAQKKLTQELAKPGVERSDGLLKQLNALVASSNAEVRQLLLRIKKEHRNLYNAISIKPGQLVRRRAAIPEGATIVQYFMASNKLYAFLISKDQAQARAVQVPVAADTLNAAISEFRRELVGDQEALTKISRKLNGWLLEPLQQHLGRNDTLLIVPFGMLYYLPFQALVTSPEDAPVRYAIEQYRISYLSSTTIDRVLAPHEGRGNPSLLAFANPDGTLPGARAETELIRKTSFPDAKVYYEKKATKSQFFDNAGKFRIIHFATHGVLDEDPLASYLIMANNRLTVDEIAGFSGLEDTTDLVVLSACSTAVELGKSTGDEVISIAEAFATAGAPALVASLWDVSDDATKELMAAFYSNLQSDTNSDVLGALRKAQLKVMRMIKDGDKPYESPVFWAAFGLVGDYR